jgi:hypothetical protein
VKNSKIKGWGSVKRRKNRKWSLLDSMPHECYRNVIACFFYWKIEKIREKVVLWREEEEGESKRWFFLY